MEQKCERRKREPNLIKCLSFTQFYHLVGCINLFLIVMGIFFIAGGLFFLINSLFCPIAYFNLICGKQSWGYVGAALILAGSTFYIIGRHKRRTDLKTAEYQEEVESLLSEVQKELNGKAATISDLDRRPVLDEIDRLHKLNKDKEREVSFLETILLRKMQVDLYSDDYLKAKVKYDLVDFKNSVGKEYDVYCQHFKEQIEKVEKDNNFVQLRVILKNLRGESQWAVFLASKGEAILESVSHWGMYAIPSLLLLGILPVLYPPFFKNDEGLSVLNWIFLGAAGAALYTVREMKAKDTTIVGEDEGNRVLRMMLLGIIIGVTTAVMLYMALKGGILTGTILPDLSFEPTGETVSNNALSIFWGLFSGFSVKLLGRLMGAAESATSISAIRGSE